MPRDQTAVPGVSSRRSACDRCRGQKLRCLRESDDMDGRCDRCAKADAQCATSPIYRMRNKFVQDGVSSLMQASRKRRRRQQDQDQSPYSLSSNPRWNSGVDSVEVLLPPASTPTDITSWNSPSIGLKVPCPGDDVEPLYNGGGSSSSPRMLLHDGLQQNSDQGISDISQEFMDLMLPDTEAESKTYDFMSELSKINATLAVHMKQIVQGRPFVTLKTLIAPECGKTAETTTISTLTPLENILNTTKAYLDILTRIGCLTQSSSPFALSSLVNPTDSCSNSYADATGSTLLSQSDSGNSSADSSAGITPPSAADFSNPAPQIDPTMQLLVLVGYIYVMRLQVAVFTHIREYLQMISQSNEPTIDPLPGLCGMGNLPLHSGNLQATLIIQFITNMLERIETMLGLPRELRVGTREDGHGGLLNQDGFLEIAKAMIRKEDRGLPEEGKGGIRSLRRDIKKSKKLLRACIAP